MESAGDGLFHGGERGKDFLDAARFEHADQAAAG